MDYSVVMVYADGFEEVVCRCYERSWASLTAFCLSEWYTSEKFLVCRQDGSPVLVYRSGDEIDVDEDDE